MVDLNHQMPHDLNTTHNTSHISVQLSSELHCDGIVQSDTYDFRLKQFFLKWIIDTIELYQRTYSCTYLW